MVKRNAARKTRHDETGRGRVPGSGGRRRGEHEMQDITHQVVMALLYGQGRTEISRALGKYLKSRGWQATDAPMPLETVDDYIRRANVLLEEEKKLERDDAREAAIRRNKRRLIKADADKRHRDAIAVEGLLIKLEGTEAPQVIELGGPGGGPISVKSEPEAIAALRRLVKET